MFTLRLVALLALMLLAILLCGCPKGPEGKQEPETPITVGDGGSLYLDSPQCKFICYDGNAIGDQLDHRDKSGRIAMVTIKDGATVHNLACPSHPAACLVEIKYGGTKAELRILGTPGNGLRIQTVKPPKFANWIADPSDKRKTFDPGSADKISLVKFNNTDYCTSGAGCQVGISYKHPTAVPATCK